MSLNAVTDYENPAVERLIQIIKFTMIGLILLTGLIMLTVYLVRGH